MGIFGEFFRRIFLKEFIWRNFLGGFFGRIFLGGFFGEEFFGRNYLVEIIKELMFLSRFWGNARRRRKDKKFRSLEVRGKLIALKKAYTSMPEYVVSVYLTWDVWL